MRKLLVLMFLLKGVWVCSQTDTTRNVILDEVVITATLTEKKLMDVSAQAEVITRDRLESVPNANLDDVLKESANVYVNRSWGIFSKNSSVTMRGLESSSRTLILVDGIPKNKLSGGSVNWHNIPSEQVERIEVIKGPASALYGNNAMGGVINIITKKPDEKFHARLKSYLGSLGTMGGNLDLSGSDLIKGRGFFWNAYGNYRRGDGYIYEPPEFIGETDIETYLLEYGGGLLWGYQFKPDNQLVIQYDHYDETRGKGTQVFEEMGSHDAIITQQLKGVYRGKHGGGELDAIVYHSYEDFYSLKESMNDYLEYKLVDAQSYKTDRGAWIAFSRKSGKNHLLTGGLEFKSGSVEGDEIYRTSSDQIFYDGQLNVAAVFIQDDIKLLKDKVNLLAGVRFDHISFVQGKQDVLDPTKVTGFSQAFSETYDGEQWAAVSPKLTLQYHPIENARVYVSVGTGYKPPKIDDLVKSGKINRGFRLANPQLKPEKLINYELGAGKTFKNVTFNAAVYYTRGRDFHYLVGTGDSIDTGGNSLKPVYYRDNVVKVQVIGGEASLRYQVIKNLQFSASYAYNHSTILEYAPRELNVYKDLNGKYIIEVSPHLFFADLLLKNRWVNVNINCTYTDEQWYDDENTILIEDYFIVNMKLYKNLSETWKVYFDLFNVFDNEYIDRKGQLSPGRFIMGGFVVNIHDSKPK